MGTTSTSSYIWKCPCGGESGFTLNIFSPHCERCGKTPNDFAICNKCKKILEADEICYPIKPLNAFSPWKGLCLECIKSQKTRYKVKSLMRTIKETFQKICNTGRAECRLCGFQVRGSDYGEILEKLGEHWEKGHKTNWS